eukprot:CAMPEP_0180562704 /NCGR_PEP_ID=MMETSP1037_2-20121125/4062_1 /TAXON_ID=632150 /ORGANISM="Azadinium spinosum, Strain 3D9" /LENGTH=84 /DNA_ID=CAMNT_0022579441 /DNA_START=141 /DNA_END=392 /DNA_ORIENTATION=-
MAHECEEERKCSAGYEGYQVHHGEFAITSHLFSRTLGPSPQARPPQAAAWWWLAGGGGKEGCSAGPPPLRASPRRPVRGLTQYP